MSSDKPLSAEEQISVWAQKIMDCVEADNGCSTHDLVTAKQLLTDFTSSQRAQERQLVEAEIAARDLRIADLVKALEMYSEPNWELDEQCRPFLKWLDPFEECSEDIADKALAKSSPSPSAVARVVQAAEDWFNATCGDPDMHQYEGAQLLYAAVEAMREGRG